MKTYEFENASVEYKNGKLIVKVDDDYAPKDGDFCSFAEAPNVIFIYKASDTKVGVAYYAACIDNSHINFSNHHPYYGFRTTYKIVQATDEQIKIIKDKLKDKNLAWNSITKKVVAWKAQYGEYYYFVSDRGVETAQDLDGLVDAHRYGFGNYFSSKEMANDVWTRFVEVLSDVDPLK